jgi:hypothetical protein
MPKDGTKSGNDSWGVMSAFFLGGGGSTVSIIRSVLVLGPKYARLFW